MWPTIRLKRPENFYVVEATSDHRNHVLMFRRILFSLIPLIWTSASAGACGAADPTVPRSEEPDSVYVAEAGDMIAVAADSVIADVDSLPLPPDMRPDWWLNRIKAHDYSIYDTSVVYPKFLDFCVRVYRWGDRTFNTYDNDYVLPTGKNWKLMLQSKNWTDSYAMNFEPKIPVRMLSNVYASLGGYISFMAVSVGYSLNMSKIIGHKEGAQKRWDFSFNTALFTVDAYYSSNDGGTIIRRFGDYDDGRWIHVDFPALRLKSYGADAYYFFNHKRYSQGAVYNFSKYQLRSQGSWILGFSAGHSSIKMDFSALPDDMQACLPDERRQYNFINNDYSLLVGYGYNWVFNPKWCLNITGLPAVGVKHTFPESIEGEQTRLSLGMRGRLGMVYNIGSLFLGISGRFDGHFHINPGFNFFNAIITFGGTFGFRF